MRTTTYRLAGLRIASEFPLFGVQVCGNEAQPHCDVVIRCGSIPEKAALAAAKFHDGRYSGTYNGKELLLSRPVGRFLVREGEEILVDLPPYAKRDEVRAYLLGAVFGTLCHQRGITPLHASAVDVANGCALFVGPSGAGKSTLAAALSQRGHEVIADDACFLQLGPDGDILAWPGITKILLWHDAKVALGINEAGVEREMQGCPKYFIPIRQPPNPTRARSLRRVYLLHRALTGKPEATRLRGGDAVEALLQNIYPPGLTDGLGYQPHIFNMCAAVARDVPVFRLTRTCDFAALDREIEFLERQLGELA